MFGKEEWQTHFIDNKEKQPIHEDTPDCNIGQDTSWKSVGMDSNGTIPVQCHESPS